VGQHVEVEVEGVVVAATVGEGAAVAGVGAGVGAVEAAVGTDGPSRGRHHHSPGPPQMLQKQGRAEASTVAGGSGEGTYVWAIKTGFTAPVSSIVCSTSRARQGRGW
jgi:hypothetical protein